MTINDLQDKTTTERMNWVVFSTLSQAQENNKNHLKEAFIAGKNYKNGTFEILPNKIIPIHFEGNLTQARKIVFLEKNTHPILKSYTEEKKLISYFIAAQVRNRFVPCILSFYESQLYNENSLPSMLSVFLKKQIILFDSRVSR